ncbi:enoyl Coenzyme A hydratase [Phytophthora cinnamomi]|uniref:enoyl Coenzyme A hydratase n=1 Tax=Phytophthora cinnamomi TaxID=4785 RepID=UPI00355A4926|nr:enoyl Coenzyme A hydratase [Phytophthora cinnamomi]
MASVCSACQAADKAVSRCSQCKWAAYCSKTCQRDHWKAGHRLMCAKLRVSQRFRDLETRWWRSRPPRELQTFVVQLGLQPESMSFFGEVLFLLCGVKPCVLLSNLPPTWRQSFTSDVVVSSGLVQGPTPCSVALYSVGTRLETPAEYDLTGDLVLANTQHAEFAMAERTLRLAAVTLDATSGVQLAAVDSSRASELVQEQELARVLDYPVALNECTEEAPMVEVGYFLEEGHQRVLLTSYCAMATPHHAQRVQQHFERYRDRNGGLRLALHKSQI